MSFQPTFQECLPVQCGAVADYANKVACAEAGFVGTRSPFDPLCPQYDSISVPVLPQYVLPPPPSSPNIVMPPETPISVSDLRALALPKMPTNVHPPDYCGSAQYLEYAGDDIGDGSGVDTGSSIDQWICSIGSWANNNPWMAVGALAVAYWVAGETMKRRAARKAKK